MLSTVRLGSLTYPSIFITSDPNVKTIADFKGKKFAFVDKASASGFLYPFAALKSAGYIKGSGPDAATEFFSDVQYAGTHPNVVTAVYNGQVAGGACFGGPLNPSTGIPTDARSQIAAAHPDVYQKVRIVGETQLIPNDTVTARKGLPAEIVKQIQGGLLQMTTMPEGRKLLYSLYNIDDLAPVNDSFYDPLRQVAQDAGLTNFETINATPTPKP